LTKNGWTIKIVWIPSHRGIEGNEEADILAKRGAEQNQTPCSQAYTSYAWMNRMAKDKFITKWCAELML
jgi:ribonuclease HI